MTWEQIHSDKNVPSQLRIYHKADLLSILHLLLFKENGEVWIPGELTVKPSVILTAARTILIPLAALVTENSLSTSCTV